MCNKPLSTQEGRCAKEKWVNRQNWVREGKRGEGDEFVSNRNAIALAGPFKMLVQQLWSESARVRMLAAAVLATTGAPGSSTSWAPACNFGFSAPSSLLLAGFSAAYRAIIPPGCPRLCWTGYVTPMTHIIR